MDVPREKPFKQEYGWLYDRLNKFFCQYNPGKICQFHLYPLSVVVCMEVNLPQAVISSLLGKQVVQFRFPLQIFQPKRCAILALIKLPLNLEAVTDIVVWS
jgi:hypothetical protein